MLYSISVYIYLAVFYYIILTPIQGARLVLNLRRNGAVSEEQITTQDMFGFINVDWDSVPETPWQGVRSPDIELTSR